MRSIRVARGLLIALTAAIAVALILNGNVVFGVLIGALAVVRLVLFTRVQQRREEIRRRVQQRRNFPPPRA